MWNLYSNLGKGVAITSTPVKLAASLTPFRLKPDYGIENLWGGNVSYVDLLKERLRVGMIERFYFKHNAFSWEQEFRMAISVRMAEEFGVNVPENGMFVQANVSNLIEEIHIGPALEESERESILGICKLHNLEERIHISSLLGRPRYV